LACLEELSCAVGRAASSGKLLIWASAVATAGWPVALERAIKKFNRAAHARRLALRFELATKESDAQVTFGVGQPEEFQSSTHGTTSLRRIFRRVTWLNSFRGDSRMRIKNLMD
jgi:hypothetical protein